MDLTTLTDDELDGLRRDVLVEQERRASLDSIPTTVADLARTYTAGGGNPADLVTAIEGDPNHDHDGQQ